MTSSFPLARGSRNRPELTELRAGVTPGVRREPEAMLLSGPIYPQQRQAAYS
jgi:hypothetical protein